MSSAIGLYGQAVYKPVRRRAAASGFKEAARHTAERMAEASGAKRRAAPMGLKAIRTSARRTAGEGAASTRAASPLLKAASSAAWCMGAAGAAKRRAAASWLKTASTARGTEGASAARRWTASSTLDTEHCIAHGGGRRCQHLGCPKAAATRGTPHWRGQALPARGLLQASRSSSRQCVLQALSPAPAARRCVGQCTATAWRGPGAPSHG
jgi:hypothetical protein